jgi:hypothetical protein
MILDNYDTIVTREVRLVTCLQGCYVVLYNVHQNRQRVPKLDVKLFLARNTYYHLFSFLTLYT